MLKLLARWAPGFKVSILVGLAIYFAYIYLSGKWAYYIDPRFQWLSIVAVLLLAMLALSFTGSRSENHEHDHEDPHDHHHETVDEHDHEAHSHGAFWPIFIVAIPLVLGVAVPAKPLGAGAIKTRGIDADFSSITLSQGSTTSLSIIASERNVLDWARAIASSSDPREFIGQDADVIGFVYRDSRFSDNQFFVTRFTLTCCVADALPVGLVVQVPEDGTQYATDSWVRVKGHFEEVSFDGTLIPVLFADEVIPIEQPEQPYLYQ
jgi:putative membrane protein